MTNKKHYLPDISSILYLARMGKHHTNVYRFTMTMSEEVDPVLLQKAVEIITPRFPVLLSGFQPDFFKDAQVPYHEVIRVQKDTDYLVTMTKEEIERCALRVLYRDHLLSFECFHAQSDGYGAVAFISTLTAEYLKLRYQIEIPSGYPVLNVLEPVKQEEECDEYLQHAASKASKLKKLYAYQLPKEDKNEWNIKVDERTVSASRLKQISKEHGVSATAFLSALMAESIMKIQKKNRTSIKPVRIMIPVNLRGFFPSVTMRNFIETIFVTMHDHDTNKSLKELCAQFRNEMKQRLTKEHLSGLVKAHVDAQTSLLFRMIPRAVKYFAFKAGYAFFGESNSSITFTNLGVVNLPEAMHPYISKIDCYLSPRTGSPYNCAMITYRDQVSINFSRYNHKKELEELFYERLHQIMSSFEMNV